mmetsp:Transcript_1206/g.1243  ORF Transcript_1206/g.1243 Transcript_1206/m.1243 type:complete len:121 (-) Transcript_1206:2554-2916(-)
MSKLGFHHRSEVEEIVVESIIAGLFQAKIDQLNSLIHVFSVQTRSNFKNNEEYQSSMLQRWASSCNQVLTLLGDSEQQKLSTLEKDKSEAKALQASCEGKKKLFKDASESGGDSFDIRKK